MVEKDNNKTIIEVVRHDADWLDLPPRLSVKKEGDKDSTIYGKSSLNDLNIGILELNVFDGFDKQPPSDNSWGFTQRVFGEGCISSTTLGRRFLGDTIGIFGNDGERTDRIHVDITCESYEPTEEERKECIEEKGIDTSEHDHISLGYNGNEFYITIALREQKKFNELIRRVTLGEITSLGICISELDKVAGLYRPEYDYIPEVDFGSGQSFYLLDDSVSISNLSDEELNSIPNQLHFDSYYWQLTSKYSIVDFSIIFNPSWVTPELFGEEDEEEFDDIEEDIEEEYENPFDPKVPSSHEHIAEQTLVLNRIYKVLTVIAFVIILWVFLEQ